MATNFIVSLFGQQVDLGASIQNQTIIMSTNNPTNQEYSMTFNRKTAIKTSDIKLGMNGYCLNGQQQYTFGPVQQGLWIGGGNGTNTVAYSNDGINWYGLGISSSTVFGASGTIYGFAYNGKIWVAVGSGTGTIAYSFDGKIWFQSNVFSTAGYVVVWNGTMFVAGGVGTTAFAYSYDGINWSASPSYGSITVSSLAWNGSFWLAGENATTAYIYSSIDGITWSITAKSFSTNISCIAWNGYFWLASGNGATAYSSDGITWNSSGVNSVISSNLNFACWDGTKWVVGGNGTGYSIAYTYDAKGNSGWTGTSTGGTSNIKNDIYWNGKLFVGGGLSTNNTAIYSLNGFSWPSSITTNLITTANAFAYNNTSQHSVTFPRYTIVAGSNGTTDLIQYSYDGITWSSALNVATGMFASVSKIAYNGTIWLAAGTPGNTTIAYSYNGFKWNTLRTSIFQTAGVSFVWNGTLWVATGVSSTTGWNIAYSYDGLTWVGVVNRNVFFSNGSSSAGARGVAWNGRMFICVGTGTSASNCIIYSYNGINWFSTGQSIFTTTGNDVVWNGSLWIAVGQGTNSIAYSYNGLNWTGLGTSITSQANSIAWNGKLAILTHANGVAYSADGISWTSITSVFSNGTAYGIAWDGSRWQLGSSTSTSAYSYTGLNWTTYTASSGRTQTNSFASTYKIIPRAYIQHPSVATGAGQNTIAYSDDGITWTGLGSTIFSNEGHYSLWNGQIWVAVGFGTNTIAYSNDGFNWKGLGSSIFSVAGNDLAWNGNIWIATGNDPTNTLAYSYNGINWIGLGKSIFSIQGLGVSWNGYTFVAMGEGTNSIAYSTNGINWTGIGTSVFTTRGYEAFSNGVYWVATGSGSTTLAYTTDLTGSTGWTSIPGIFGTAANELCWNGSTWVAVGSGGYSIAYSTNGTSWTGITSSTNLFTTGGLGCCWNGTRFIATGEGGNSIAYSADGINWYPGYNGLSNASSTQVFTIRGNSVSSNPRIGVPVVDSQLILNSSGPSGKSTLQINSSPYYQRGFNEISFKVEQNGLSY